MSRRPLVAGNWKMNGDRRVALAEFAEMARGYDAELRRLVDLAVFPPATLLYLAAAAAIGSQIAIGGQNCHDKASGAHTGDVSAEMLADAGAAYVIVGHSERRASCGETDARVAAKALAAFRAGLVPIVCVGETREQREAGLTIDVLDAQIDGSVPDALGLVVAYEPVWAIGTGQTPTHADVAAAHGAIRRRLEAKKPGLGATSRILYGGSVKPANAADLLAIQDVDGALVGGASLRAAEFMAIAGVYRTF